MNKWICSLMVFVFIVFCCCKTNKKTVNSEGDLERFVSQLVMFKVWEDYRYLDTAMIILERIEKNGQLNDKTKFEKGEIFYYLQEYNKAISEWEKVNERIFSLPEMKLVAINRARIKQAEQSGEIYKIDSLNRSIISIYEQAWRKNQRSYGIVLQINDDNKIYNSPVNLLLVELYHYKFQVSDSTKVLNEMDSLQQITKGNEVYFERLKKLFKEKKYSTLLE